jgi:hypothetical protein
MRAQSSYSAMTLTYIQSSLSPLSAPLPPKMSLGHVWTVCFNAASTFHAPRGAGSATFPFLRSRFPVPGDFVLQPR